MNHCTAGTGTHNTPSFVKFENSLIQSVSAIYCCSRDLVTSSFSNFFSLLDFSIGFILAVALTQKLSEAKRTRWSTPSSMQVAWATRLVDKLPWSLVWMTSFGRWRICVSHGRTLLEPVSKHWSLDRDLGIQGWMDGDARGCICYLQGKWMACLQVWLEGEFLWESSCSFILQWRSKIH